MSEFVAGDGPLPCVGMVLGEAPGRRELAVGKPFVGPSGQLLNQAFTLLGISRDELYITNVCKMMPVDDVGAIRRPTPEEIQQWLPMFKVELEQCSPGAVLLLGKTAAESWGYSDELVDRGIFSASHPAFILRQMREDPLILDRWLFQINPFVRTVKELQAAL